MSVRKRIATALLLLLPVLLFPGCSGIRKLKDIKVNSVGVKYLTPVSQRSVEGVLLLEIDNPAIGLTMSDVDGTVRLNGREMGYFTAGELPLQERSVQVYELPCTATLADDVTLIEVLKLLSKRSLDGFTADVRLHATLKNGVGKTLEFKDIDIQKLTQ